MLAAFSLRLRRLGPKADNTRWQCRRRLVAIDFWIGSHV